jgi:hypothetical protein
MAADRSLMTCLPGADMSVLLCALSADGDTGLHCGRRILATRARTCVNPSPPRLLVDVSGESGTGQHGCGVDNQPDHFAAEHANSASLFRCGLRAPCRGVSHSCACSGLADAPCAEEQLDIFRYVILGLGIPSTICTLLVPLVYWLQAELDKQPCRCVWRSGSRECAQCIRPADPWAHVRQACQLFEFVVLRVDAVCAVERRGNAADSVH